MNNKLYFENHHMDMVGDEHKYTLYVAFVDDEEKNVIGYVSYTILDNELYVDHVEVKEDYRRMGIAKEIYKELYRINHNCKFKQAGYYTEEGKALRLWFEKEILKIHVLTRDGKVLFEGTENECYFKLHKVQSQSFDWAIKYEGYNIEPIHS